MFLKILKFVRLPMILIVLWTALRFWMGARGVPYAPRGNATFSIVGLTFISAVYFGSLSKKVGDFNWLGTFLVGAMIGLTAQIMILSATALSYALHLESVSYFTHWDALNVAEGTTLPMGEALVRRAPGLFFGSLFPGIAACIGRALGFFAPSPADFHSKG